MALCSTKIATAFLFILSQPGGILLSLFSIIRNVRGTLVAIVVLILAEGGVLMLALGTVNDTKLMFL